MTLLLDFPHVLSLDRTSLALPADCRWVDHPWALVGDHRGVHHAEVKLFRECRRCWVLASFIWSPVKNKCFMWYWGALFKQQICVANIAYSFYTEISNYFVTWKWSKHFILMEITTMMERVIMLLFIDKTVVFIGNL
jgi:hypothetical protein